MGTRHDLPTLRKRLYISPVFIVRGDVAMLTHGSKTIGNTDGWIFTPDNVSLCEPNVNCS